MNTEIVEHNDILKRDMLFSKADAFFYAVMAGAGEGYLVAFALESGMDPIYSGLLATLPLFFGGVLQFFVHNWVEKRGSYHSFTYLGSFLQALAFLPLIISALFKFESFPIFLMINSFYWVMAFAVAASWNVLMSSIIPHPVRNSFFSNRSTYTYSGMFLGMIFSGTILQWGRMNGNVIEYFAYIFLLSMLARIVSSFFLKKHSLITNAIKHSQRLTLKQWHAFIREAKIGKVMLFAALFKIPIYLASPFFIPYMIKEIKMSYVAFMIVISAALVGKILISRKLDWLASKLSMRKLLFFSGLGIALIPFLWIVSRDIYYLIFLQIFSGMAWGGFEYSFFLTVLNELPRNDQARFMSLYNLLNASAIIVGSILSALSFSHPLFALDSYIYIFILSGIFRTSSLIFFPQFFQKMQSSWRRKLIMRPFGIRPNQGPVDRPVIIDQQEN